MENHFTKSIRIIFSLIIFGALVFIAANRANAVVLTDSSSSTAAFDGVTGVSTVSWSHTIGGNSNRALFVGVSTAAINIGSPVARVTSVTYGTQTLTRVTNGFRASPDSNNAVELFLLVNPTSGTNTITVNLLPSAANYVVGGSISFSGVSQAVPTGTFVSTTNALNSPTNTASVSVTDSLVGDTVLDVIGTSFNAQSVVPNASQIRQWRQSDDLPNPPPPFNVGAGSTKPGASPSVLMSWTLQNAQNWALGAIAVKAAPPSTASTSNVSGRTMTAKGKAVSRVFITMTDERGNTRTTLTNMFGYYQFANVPSSATYVFEARSKQYRFPSRIINLNEDSGEFNFIADF